MRLRLALMTCLLTVACSREDVVWPISGAAETDADAVADPFGPRDQSGKHDFHAGMDFPVPEGTKIHAIKAGTVEKLEDDDGGTGPGNWVLVDHGGGEKSAYLHLSKFSVKAGQTVSAGTVIGRSGSTGSRTPHLHLNYMLDVEGSGADESLAHNPLELLPHSDMPTPEVSWTTEGVTLDMVASPMTIQEITIEGGGQSRTLDYAEVLALGNPDRDDTVQAGLELDVGDREDGRFTLTLTPTEFVAGRIVAVDYAGDTVVDASR